MSRPGRANRLVGTIALLMCILADGEARAATPVVDGWHTWRVPAVEGAPAWCCYRWSAGSGQPETCRLDSERLPYGSNDQHVNNTGEMQIYVRLADGDVDRLRALSPQCPVETEEPINDLGVMAAGESVTWLNDRVATMPELRAAFLAAIAVHRGEPARRLLTALARNADDIELRKDAVFWMSQTRIDETAAEIKSLLKSDPSQELRKHAAFAYSQSVAADRVEVLIDIVENRNAPASERRQALFWLAQSGSEPAFAYLGELLATR